uniref:Transposase n=1 Tax=Heterorhabditis bacteriophora TaxID=37862 RepID=A0A1I7WES9_HETBA
MWHLRDDVRQQPNLGVDNQVIRLVTNFECVADYLLCVNY